MSKYTFAAIILVIMATASFTAAGALVITGNTLNFTPQAKPTVVLTSNSTATPYVGDTIHLTALISPPSTPAQVAFIVNGVSKAVVPAVNGQATYDYVVPDTTALAIYPSATI
jgi:P pilus assembly chaperone PapD